MNITCRKTKCKYNNNYACNSKNIFIQKNLNCAYYEPIEKNELYDVSKTMFEIAPEIAPFRDKKDVNIFCEADCIFNKFNKCLSNGIFVNGESELLNQKKDTEILDNEKKDKLQLKNTKKMLRNKTFEIQEKKGPKNCKGCSVCDTKYKTGEASCFSFVKK